MVTAMKLSQRWVHSPSLTFPRARLARSFFRRSLFPFPTTVWPAPDSLVSRTTHIRLSLTAHNGRILVSARIPDRKAPCLQRYLLWTPSLLLRIWLAQSGMLLLPLFAPSTHRLPRPSTQDWPVLILSGSPSGFLVEQVSFWPSMAA